LGVLLSIFIFKIHRYLKKEIKYGSKIIEKYNKGVKYY